MNLKMSFFILSLGAILFMSFTSPTLSSPIETTTTETEAKQSITVIVKNKSGSYANYAKVGYDVCESIACIGGKSNFRTNSDGKVTIDWTSGCDICIIYVDGKAHKDKYRDGGTYTITR